MLLVVLLTVTTSHWPELIDPIALAIAILSLFSGEGGPRGPGSIA